MIFSAIVAFVATVLSSLILTVIVYRIATRIGLVDVPDAHRKLHIRPRALGGGVAIYLAAALTLGLLLVVPNAWKSVLRPQAGSLAALLTASLAIVVLGLIDDHKGLRGRQKMLGQIAAASILLLGNLLVRRVVIFGWDIELGLLAVPFTLFWLLGAINAVNLLDGLDGLATTIGIIFIATISAMAAMTGKPAVAIIALVFAASLVGFLPMNFPPARIFLGDAGSMLVGLMVGALAIQGSLKGAGTVLLAAPLALWTIPIFDSTTAILRRKLTGRSIYTTDHGHLHHRMLDRLGSSQRALALVAASCGITSLSALAAVFWKDDAIALICCVAVVFVFIVTGVFGRAEALLLVGHLRDIAYSLVYPSASEMPPGVETAVRLQGSRPWEVLWANLTEAVDAGGMSEVRLDLTFPADKEDYHAVWKRPGCEDESHWRLEFPLVINEQPIGRVTIGGQRNSLLAREEIERLAQLVHPFEMELLEFVGRDDSVWAAEGMAAAPHAKEPIRALPRRVPR